MIKYKGYVGEYEFDEEEHIFIGKIVNCEDLVTFEGKSLEETEESFQEAVDDYMAWCKKYRKIPTRSPLLEQENDKDLGKGKEENRGGGDSN